MRVSDYDRFVRETDQSICHPLPERMDIAIYGLTGEIGSVVTAIKKRLLTEGPNQAWKVANDEIIEELGDVIWYCFCLAQISNPDKPVNIFAHDIKNIKKELLDKGERGKRIRSALDESKMEEFLKEAEKFPRSTRKMIFEDYQNLAFLTARTQDKTLTEVSLAVLLQLAAQLFRNKLPEIEKELNKAVVDQPINDVLGEMAWHVSALSRLFGLSLSEIAEKNKEKISSRWDRSEKTPLHDSDFEIHQQIPRNFEVIFVQVGEGRTRMYLDGHVLGNELTDNSYIDDGYRYHDIMHLANAARLGWSPVLRGLLGRKRKRERKIDEVEDGARAQIVEEAVIKAIHSEGERLASLKSNAALGPVNLFSSGGEISFQFLRFIKSLVIDLEVRKNKYWEWEQAILDGHEIFYKLRCEKQGTVVVDLNERTIQFKPEVCIGLNGRVAGLGSSLIHKNDLGQSWAETDLTPQEMAKLSGSLEDIARFVALKRALLTALGVPLPTEVHFNSLTITELSPPKTVSVKATGIIQRLMWDRKIVDFQVTNLKIGESFQSTVVAMSDI